MVQISNPQIAIRGSTLSFCISIYSNSQIKTFLLLEFLSSGKPKIFHLHLYTITLYTIIHYYTLLYTIFLYLESIVAPNTNGGAYSSLPCPIAAGTLYIYNTPSIINILHIYNTKI